VGLTEAVKFWTDGKHTNHGFMMHGDSKDYFRAYFREAEKVKDRPGAARGLRTEVTRVTWHLYKMDKREILCTRRIVVMVFDCAQAP